MNKESQNSLQNLLFQRVQESIPPHCSLVDELSELLKISNDSVYRRLRNETMLSIDEVGIICKQYSISFDSISKSDSTSVVCNYALLRNEQDLVQHLTFMSKELDLYKSLPDAHITYAAIDIPIFHHFEFKELTTFKIYYWLRSVINDENFSDIKYNSNLVSEEHMKLYKHMFNTYNSCNVTEIWTDSTIKSLIKQIDFFWESGMFENKEDAILICKQAEDEIIQIQKQAEKPITKDNGHINKLYFSEIELGNNSILAKWGSNKRTYLTYNTINILISSNNGFCNETEIWQQNLIKKSTLISGASEKIRYQFFKRLLDDIGLLRKKIES
ncbi:MAG TPA: hypothetical protein PK734_01075 [Bacteroidales bacterium]|nr:hypothetical protein [Bacteroidales bacterium]